MILTTMYSILTGVNSLHSVCKSAVSKEGTNLIGKLLHIVIGRRRALHITASNEVSWGLLPARSSLRRARMATFYLSSLNAEGRGIDSMLRHLPIVAGAVKDKHRIWGKALFQGTNTEKFIWCYLVSDTIQKILQIPTKTLFLYLTSWFVACILNIQKYFWRYQNVRRKHSGN